MSLTRAIRSSLQRRQARLSEGDAGTTLMEMVVVLFLLGLIGSMLIVFTTSAMRNTRYTDGQQQDLLQARNALDAMTKNLRSAVPINTSPVTLAFSQASNTSVTFYANNGTVTGALTNTGPTLTRYYFNTTTRQLIEESTDAVGSAPPYTWPTANKTTRVLAANLINPQPIRPDITGTQPLGGPIFSFSDRTGAAIPVDSTGAVSSLGLATIRQVQVWISLRSGSTNPGSITSITGQAQIVSGYDPDGSSVS